MKPSDIFDLASVVLQENAEGYEVETLSHYLIDGVYTKVFVAKKAGTFIGQHSHAYAHGHLVASGAVRLFKDGRWAGDFAQGAMITIAAGKKHILMSLEDNTVGACIHNVHGETEPEILEEAVFAAS